MSDIATLLAAPALDVTAFPPNSRYFGLGVATLPQSGGEIRTYVKRRFVPQSADLTVVGHHRVAGGERADTIAARTFGDATQMWRLSDANGLDAASLTAPVGRVLKVALPNATGSTSGA